MLILVDRRVAQSTREKPMYGGSAREARRRRITNKTTVLQLQAGYDPFNNMSRPSSATFDAGVEILTVVSRKVAPERCHWSIAPYPADSRKSGRSHKTISVQISRAHKSSLFEDPKGRVYGAILPRKTDKATTKARKSSECGSPRYKC